MKRLLLLSLLLVAAVCIYLGINKGWFNGSKPSLSNFAIGDTSGINKIFMVDKAAYRRITLEKIDGLWMVNGKWETNKGWMDQLLETISRVKVKSPVPKTDFDGVVKRLATSHVKVEIYKNDELVKTYFVGDGTPNVESPGTYMLMDGSSTPFICEIAGFTGFLTPRFNLDEQTWRSRRVFGIPAQQIKSVFVAYPANPTDGFSIRQSENGTLSLSQSVVKSVILMNLDTTMLRYYLALFKDVHAEGFGTITPGENIDSIYHSNPWCIINIETKTAKNSHLLIYRKPVDQSTKNQYTPDGKAQSYDTDRYYAFLNGSKEPMIIQDYVFANFFRTYTDFQKK